MSDMGEGDKTHVQPQGGRCIQSEQHRQKNTPTDELEACRLQSKRDREMSLKRSFSSRGSAKYFNGSANKVLTFSVNANKVFFKKLLSAIFLCMEQGAL